MKTLAGFTILLVGLMAGLIIGMGVKVTYSIYADPLKVSGNHFIMEEISLSQTNCKVIGIKGDYQVFRCVVPKP